MKLHGTMKINSLSHLEIGGCDCTILAKDFGTPLYIMDEQLIRENCRSFVKAFSDHYPDIEIVYAGKAFLTMAMVKIIQSEGLSLDVVSGGELYTAYRAGFPMERIYFHGNNKTPEELTMGLELGIGHFVVDNLAELEMLDKQASSMGIKQKVLIRVSPGITADTHHYIQTGQLDSKFGFPLYRDSAFRAVKEALDSKSLIFNGLHCHIGSQITDVNAFTSAAQTMLSFAARTKEELRATVNILNLGGGFGIDYTGEDGNLFVGDFSAPITATVKEALKKYRLPPPRLVVEPGRYIVGNAGTTLYSVGSVKDIPEVRKFVFVDGGMSDNPRPALYHARYRAAVANRMSNSYGEKVTVAGKCCESGDILVKDIRLPEIKSGDLLAVLSTGAYNYSMASNYNRLPRPAVVLVKDGRADLVVKRESYKDVIRNDVIPDRLKK
ncbi:MAG: diaminopimelate decarboxylase [Clostridia bacterium]|jgi:diaminopimelate decarboxylase|nr:diaminopimelate decarboxylase [Clostridiales bacterium]